jgi:hypothetical protein
MAALRQTFAASVLACPFVSPTSGLEPIRFKEVIADEE